MSMHHAYFVEGERDAAVGFVKRFCEEKLGVAVRGNPDFWHGTYETLLLGDAQDLRTLQESRPVGKGPRVFVLSLVFMTGEAQNALLKTFEEPTSDSYFFITAPSSAILLPTLRSRLRLEKLPSATAQLTSARIFLAASPGQRMKLVKPLAEKGTDEPKKTEALALLSELEVSLHQSFKGNRTLAGSLCELLILKHFLFSRAPSIKMITEYLSLTLPRLK